MSERILNALMQLFAIIAKVDDSENSEDLNYRVHQVIRSFLKGELSPDKVEIYVRKFDDHFNSLRNSKNQKTGARKRNAVNSVKVLRICSEVNEELTQRQKFIVLVRILELILEDTQASTLELEFVRTVADTFNIRREEHELILNLLMDRIDLENPSSNNLILTGKKTGDHPQKVHVHSLNAPIVIIRIASLNLLFFKYLGTDDIFLNGQILKANKVYLFNQGGSLKTARSQSIYQSDLLNRFVTDKGKPTFVFEASDISYKFKGDNIGLHPFSFKEKSGKLVGIMGGSGTGKSTLINLLNGSLQPATGQVTINGFDIHHSPKDVEGLIGHISQDDLLIEELTVFENLYFSAKLCFDDLTERELTRKVVRLLHALGLYDVKDLKVGNPLEKTISGGQRKRLNIGLELIREPAVLFVDEPTSGLSSRDSLNIMNLLKELSFRGKLIFVVIHQPSSEIFKLFNRLIIMDQGGYPIFDGNPVNALVYFKTQLNFVNADESECSLCGNVNPEQIFDIVEARVVDEYGHSTNERRSSPVSWYERYLTYKKPPIPEIATKKLKPESSKPSVFRQFVVFFTRDFLSKASNRQYLLITLLEAPALAAILAFFMKFFESTDDGRVYSFFKNENIPHFIFVSVLVAIFFGMTVAAEEINKDKKILKREQFLNLSRGSYLLSKVSILVIISFIQTGLFILVGNSILGIKGMWLEYWTVLFSTAVWANLVGLNISSAFNLAKVIYIVVPILIIPQLLFSGALVKFDRLHPTLTHPTEVPWIGNLMLSRWSYEALSVEQATSNAFNVNVYPYNKKLSVAKWKKDYWIPEMQHLAVKTEYADIVQNEIERECERWTNLRCDDCYTDGHIKATPFDQFLRTLKQQYTEEYNRINDSLEIVKRRIGLDRFAELKDNYSNENLRNIVTNRYTTEKIQLDRRKRRILQVEDPIYFSSPDVRFLDSPMFSKNKYVFGQQVSTYSSNLVVIWLYTILAYIALYYDWLRKVMEFSKAIYKRRK